MSRSKIRNTESGQALLEYILLLVVIVAAVFILKQSLFKQMGNFVNTMMGSYLGCLLDYAVLPGDPNCAAILSAAAPKGDASASGGVNDGGGSLASQNGGGSGASSTQKEMLKSRGGASSSGGGNRNAGKASHTRNNSTNKAQSSTEVVLGPSDGTGSSGEPESSSVGSVKPKTASVKVIKSTPLSNNGRRFVTGYGGLSDQEEEKRARIAEKVLTVGTVSSSAEDMSGVPKRMKIIPPVRKSASVEESGSGITFGSIGRIVIIGVIILALLIFLGSQANQISASMDK